MEILEVGVVGAVEAVVVEEGHLGHFAWTGCLCPAMMRNCFEVHR